MKYRNEYRYHCPFGHPKHIYICRGRHGAMHFHITDLGEVHAKKYGHRYSSGLEAHHRTPPSYMDDRAPSHEECWVIGGPCWHDGTSLYAEESLLPFWLQDPHDHERMFRLLEREYEDRFGVSEQAEAVMKETVGTP